MTSDAPVDPLSALLLDREEHKMVWWRRIKNKKDGRRRQEQANGSRVEHADCRIMEHPNCKESGPKPEGSAFEQQQERACTHQQWKEQGGPNYPGSVTDGGRRKKMKLFCQAGERQQLAVKPKVVNFFDESLMECACMEEQEQYGTTCRQIRNRTHLRKRTPSVRSR